MSRKKLLPDMKNILPDIDIVVQKPGVVKDEYQDIRGNQLIDGPLSMDTAHCANKAKLSAIDISHVLRDLKQGTRLSDSSNAISFEGVNPIAKACAVAKAR